MQLLVSNTKNVILAAVSCLFLLVFCGINTNSASFVINNFDGFSTFNLNSQREYAHSTRIVGGEKTPAKSIWDSMSDDLNLNHKAQSSSVKSEIRKLLADKKKLYEILEQSAPYIYFIYKQTQESGLPAEIALIPAIESEFNPKDFSNKGATGLWQLMPGTARELGVKVKSNYDGRRNVVQSTNAALAYFRDLGNSYKGNWYLAIAAYDCGPAKIDSAARRAGSRNFWDLKLPKETRVYIPKLLAVAEVIKNPEKYGVSLPHVNNQPYFAEVKLKAPVELASVSKATGVSMDSLRTLNPDFKTTVVANKNEYKILVPIESAYRVASRYAASVVI